MTESQKHNADQNKLDEDCVCRIPLKNKAKRQK